MKKRHGFISNSSSSSFICDVCGEEASGMNMCLEEAEMFQCVNEHTFCDYGCCNPIVFTKEQMLKHLTDWCKTWIDREEDEYYQQYNHYHIEKAKKFSKKLEENYYLSEDTFEELKEDAYTAEIKDNRYNIPSTFCKICNFEKLISEDCEGYLLRITNKTKEEVLEEIKTKFKTYDDFCNFTWPTTDS